MQGYRSMKMAGQRQFLQKFLTENWLRERSSHGSWGWKVLTKPDGDVQKWVGYLPELRRVPNQPPLFSRVQTVDVCLLQLGTGFSGTDAKDAGGWALRRLRMLRPKKKKT